MIWLVLNTCMAHLISNHVSHAIVSPPLGLSNLGGGKEEHFCRNVVKLLEPVTVSSNGHGGCSECPETVYTKFINSRNRREGLLWRDILARG